MEQMEQFDFDTVVSRKNTLSLKWDVAEGELPLWVADMDFPTAPCVRRAIEKRAAHGIFGYSIVPKEWGEAVSDWWKTRHGFAMNSDHLIFCTGVVPAISSAVRKLSTPAEKVVVMTPVYNIFFNSIVNNGRFVLESPLAYKNGEYAIDFERLEADLSDAQVSLLLLCNPHNPVGKIWTGEELSRIGALCKKHGVTVISDEIHCDITAPNCAYTPFASVNEVNADISITLIAPTKAFNIAGVQSAAVYADNGVLRHKIWRALNTDEVAEPNAFAIDAAIAAFREGTSWLDSLREYLWQNRKIAADFIRRELPQLTLVNADATYLLWVDCSKITADTQKLTEHIRKSTGLYISSGSQYGSSGAAFVRINIACPASVLRDALNRLRDGILH